MNTQTQLPLSYKLMMTDYRKPSSTDANRLLQAIFVTTKCTFESLKSKDRHGDISEIRQIFFYLFRKHNRMFGLNSTGEILNRDHATVIYSIKRVKSLMEVEREFKALVISIEKEFIGSC